MATRTYGDPELANVRRWFDANEDSASERLVSEFEALVGLDYPAERIVATNSAMGALHIALQTAGVGPGDEVIVDPIVVFGGMAAMYQNAVPIFVDVLPSTFNMDPAAVERAMSPRTKALIVTHHFGSVADMSTIQSVARQRGVAVIEDCAHALFATRGGTRAGLFGDFAAFSFNHRKQLSTGQGGFLLINNPEYVEKSKDQGFGRIPARLSWNYAMSGLIAAVAMAQWGRAKGYVNRDHGLAELYSAAVEGCPWLVPQAIPPDNWSAFHIWAAAFQGDQFGIPYPEFMSRLRSNGVDYFLPSFVPYGAFGLDPSPVYRYPLFKGHTPSREGQCPVAEELVPRLLNTVLSPVPDERVMRYAEGLAQTVRQYS